MKNYFYAFVCGYVILFVILALLQLNHDFVIWKWTMTLGHLRFALSMSQFGGVLFALIILGINSDEEGAEEIKETETLETKDFQVNCKKCGEIIDINKTCECGEMAVVKKGDMIFSKLIK